MKLTALACLLFASSLSLAQNTLTPAEKREGWKLLFDGTSTKGWRGFKERKAGEAWKVADGALYLDNSQMDDWQTKGGGDIVTDKEYENFDLKLEWKIEACGNSGIMFNVVESDAYKYAWSTGPEMQVLDNECHPDAKIIKHRAGDLYDMISCKTETVKPAGEWNQVRILSDKGNVTLTLNGENVVNFSMNTPAWKELIAESKFKEMQGFGMAKKGHIALQDHGNKVWFRNIKIREIK